jgi:hypothetical protein
MDFTRYPAGRHRSDGHFSGERFREEFLIPAIEKCDHVLIRLDCTAGFGSSFLEEAFAGLVRAGFDPKILSEKINFESSDSTLIDEIRDYISAAPN